MNIGVFVGINAAAVLRQPYNPNAGAVGLSHRGSRRVLAVRVLPDSIIPAFGLYHPLHIPHESPQTQSWGFEVFLVQLLEDAVHLVVVNDADDGVVQGRPGMGAVVRLARLAAVAFDFVPLGEALHAIVVQDFGDFVVVGLVVCD